jgi:signal transduction histidine kinase
LASSQNSGDGISKVGTVSHRLHSSTLELLGLAVAVKALSRDFSKQYQVQASGECSDVPDNLAADVSLCLFRVMQEGLRNIAKHSRAAKIDIELDVLVSLTME